MDGTVKGSRCKAGESLGMRRTYQYVTMTKDEAQRCRWTFYEAVKSTLGKKGQVETTTQHVLLFYMHVRKVCLKPPQKNSCSISNR